MAFSNHHMGSTCDTTSRAVEQLPAMHTSESFWQATENFNNSHLPPTLQGIHGLSYHSIANGVTLYQGCEYNVRPDLPSMQTNTVDHGSIGYGAALGDPSVSSSACGGSFSSTAASDVMENLTINGGCGASDELCTSPWSPSARFTAMQHQQQHQHAQLHSPSLPSGVQFTTVDATNGYVRRFEAPSVSPKMTRMQPSPSFSSPGVSSAGLTNGTWPSSDEEAVVIPAAGPGAGSEVAAKHGLAEQEPSTQLARASTRKQLPTVAPRSKRKYTKRNASHWLGSTGTEPKRKTTRAAKHASSGVNSAAAYDASPPVTLFSNDGSAPRQAESNSNNKITPSPPCDKSNRELMDKYLLEQKRAGLTYRDIKRFGGFTEAESTLRGRYRSLTKPKEDRVRKPEWKENDVSKDPPNPVDFNPPSSPPATQIDCPPANLPILHRTDCST